MSKNETDRLRDLFDFALLHIHFLLGFLRLPFQLLCCESQLKCHVWKHRNPVRISILVTTLGYSLISCTCLSTVGTRYTSTERSKKISSIDYLPKTVPCRTFWELLSDFGNTELESQPYIHQYLLTFFYQNAFQPTWTMSNWGSYILDRVMRPDDIKRGRKNLWKSQKWIV